jgi:predicted transcriptional regulator of viral defense system
MTEKAEIQILTKIKKAKKGSLFFIENFLTKTNSDAIRKALERLVKKGEITRIAHGIYVRPASDSLLGQLTPSIETIAKAIAKRDKARIVPTGAYALNQLGLSTQVPMNIVFLTDGAPRKIDIGGLKITFKKTTPKNVSSVGQISKLAIQALRSIGSTKVTPTEILQIQNLLRKEKPTHLEHDFYLAPTWIKEIMRPILKELKK